MGSNHDLGGGNGGRAVEGALLHAVLGEFILDDRIMDKLTEDGERSLPGEDSRLGDGVADPETEAVMLGEFDDHEVLAVAYFVPQSFCANNSYRRPALTICSKSDRYSLNALRPRPVSA